ncbi:MAG: phage holin family protein [Nitrospirae bacterium]|nr:phage holin family protein [Nitrospirota bacterium]MCL5423250.1 phage holin family protein [Nitrospirota bacterium]
MSYLILRIMINALSIVIAVKLVDGLSFTGEWWKMIIVGAVFGIVNSVIKPIVQFFTIPFIILTLGLFTLIINTLMLALTAFLSDTFHLGFHIRGFWAAFWGAIIVSVVSMLLSWITGLKRLRSYKNTDTWEG